MIETIEQKRERFYNHLVGLVPELDKDVLRKVIWTEKPLMSIAMINFMRLNKLLLTLDTTLRNTVIPINLVLRVQGTNKLNQKQIKSIKDALKAYDNKTVVFTPVNEGTGQPRHDTVQLALDTYDAPFISTLDSDTLFPVGGFEAAICLMMQDPELGSASIACDPRRMIYFFETNSAGIPINRVNERATKRLTYCHTVGSATQVVRRKVYDTCTLDPEYYIGCQDFDFCMQMYRKKWKIAYLNVEGLIALNDKKDNPNKYRHIRHDGPILRKSRKRFMKKWGIDA